MAYGEIGGLMPRDSSFTSQAGYLEAAKAEGIKRANYLSQMDSFYAELEESTREFDLKLGLEREQFAESTRQFDERLEWEREYGTRSLENQADIASDQNELGWAELSLKQEIFSYEQEKDSREDVSEQDILRQVLPRTLQNMDLTNEAWVQRNNRPGSLGSGELNYDTYAQEADLSKNFDNASNQLNTEFDWWKSDASMFF